jgi:methyltransferase (TIGR00027 family)
MTNTDPNSLIHDVTDTALWVATYRAMESERPDAIFNDPYAAKLSGEKGRKIAEAMHKRVPTMKYTSWSVVIRTYIIDNYIKELLAQGVDTVVNLGAGLDARPYRMDLPKSLRWIEVDYPSIIERKQKILAEDQPKCQLERVSMDLADRPLRQKFFRDLNASAKKIVVLTEGVVPYLTEEQTATLAEDLKAQSHFNYWIVDYFSPRVYKYMQSAQRKNQMKNAPVVFYPQDWFGFFKSNGWVPKEIRYQTVESIKLGRKTPNPWWAKMLSFLMPAAQREEMKKFTGFVLLTPER